MKKTDTKRQALAAQLHEIRWQKKMTQRQLAQKMKASDAYVSAVLTGTKPISAVAINKFAKALGATVLEKRDLHILGARALGFEI